MLAVPTGLDAALEARPEEDDVILIAPRRRAWFALLLVMPFETDPSLGLRMTGKSIRGGMVARAEFRPPGYGFIDSGKYLDGAQTFTVKLLHPRMRSSRMMRM